MIKKLWRTSLKIYSSLKIKNNRIIQYNQYNFITSLIWTTYILYAITIMGIHHSSLFLSRLLHRCTHFRWVWILNEFCRIESKITLRSTCVSLFYKIGGLLRILSNNDRLVRQLFSTKDNRSFVDILTHYIIYYYYILY